MNTNLKTFALIVFDAHEMGEQVGSQSPRFSVSVVNQHGSCIQRAFELNWITESQTILHCRKTMQWVWLFLK